ncbi:hypothetical protein [Corynebacterium deserti]|uniref:hypothetical protein n=1 Tax=Corynebacterium deserti TaxID=1408191 RepID=UPI0012E12D51|nr:hypothetical protein [Corynebacterium deserti]
MRTRSLCNLTLANLLVLIAKALSGSVGTNLLKMARLKTPGRHWIENNMPQIMRKTSSFVGVALSASHIVPPKGF